MGYRSQVTIVLKKETYQKHENILREAMKGCDSIEQTDTAYYFSWDAVKWETTFENVKVIEKVLSQCDEEDYGFMRVGEEENDLDTKGTPGEFNVFLERTISSDTDKELDSEKFFSQNSVKYIKYDSKT